jgi:hypothetical protein
LRADFGEVPFRDELFPKARMVDAVLLADRDSRDPASRTASRSTGGTLTWSLS